MNNKILLYNGASVTFADMDDYPCLSLMALSAFLKKHNFQVELLKDKHTDEEIKAKLAGCLAVGFSVYTGNGIVRTLKMASRIRQISKKIPLVWGGFHPSLDAQQVLENEHADYVVRGEGEYTFYELLECIRSNSLDGLSRIMGLSFKQGGVIHHNEPRLNGELNDFPMMDYPLYDEWFTWNKSIPYICSRGCPYDCRFCCSSAFNKLHGKRFRILSLENILRDVDFIVKRYSPEIIEFIDDNFLLNKQMIVQFIDEYRKRRYSFRWWARTRCDFFGNLDDQIVKSMKEIGLIKVDLGVESGSQRILDLVRKRSDIENVLKAVRKAAKFGLWTYCTFMNGIPGETLKEVRQSIKLRNEIMRISPDSEVEFFVFTPLPGTELLEDCIKAGFSLPKRIEDYVDFNFHHYHAPWISRRHRRIAIAISVASFFDLFKTKGRNIFLRIPADAMKLDARIRFKTLCFGFAPEFHIANWIYQNKSMKT